MVLLTRGEAKGLMDGDDWGCAKGDQIYEGLKILKKYHPTVRFDYYFQHDQMWVTGFYFDDSLMVMPFAAVNRMSQLGWLENEDYWSHYSFKDMG